MHDFVIQLGRSIVDARRARGWSQQDLARAAGIARSTISAAELGTNGTTLSTLTRIAGALDLDLDHLLCRNRPANRVAEPDHQWGDQPCPCLTTTYHLTGPEAHALHRFLAHLQTARRISP